MNNVEEVFKGFIKDVRWVAIGKEICFKEFNFFMKGFPVRANVVASEQESFDGVYFELFRNER